MPDYRHYRVQGGTYLFTIDGLELRTDVLVLHIQALREAVPKHQCEQATRPEYAFLCA